MDTAPTRRVRDCLMPVTKLVLWCAFGGAAVGVVTMGTEAARARLNSDEPPPSSRTVLYPRVVSLQGQEVIDADTEEKLHALAASKQVGPRSTLRLPWWSYPALGAAAGVGVAAPFVLARAGASRNR